MLAAHRDQENLVHSHQVPTKQGPKTPGARYPKTPFKQSDENAPTVFAGKTGLGGTQAKGNDKIMMTKGKGMATPMRTFKKTINVTILLTSMSALQSRAPLGAKTTNAKARNAPTPGVKGTNRGVEKTQLKPTAQKPKPKSSLQIEVKHDHDKGPEDDEEPEYAPPRPAELPYESDILPKGGLTFEGLKKENLFRGYYDKYINPIDDSGISRQDKRFNEEMKAMVDKAIVQNEQGLEEITWNPADLQENRKLLTRKPDAPEVSEAKMARKIRAQSHQRQPSTIRSRKAAGVLSVPTDTHRPATRPQSAAAPSRRPLSTLIAGQRAMKPRSGASKPTPASNAPAEAASRTTLGYNKGKSASSAIHSHTRSQSAIVRHATKTSSQANTNENDLTITPARARQAGFGNIGRPEAARPAFMSIFELEDEEDLSPLSGPAISDDEEEFELKLDL